MISVVMSVYNCEHYLKESIESMLNQTYRNFEFIIIDDGSTDNSLKIINCYAKLDKRIVVVSRENKGLVKSLNEGFELAQGKYITRMDADDISHLKRLELQNEFMEENLNIDFCGTNYRYIGDGVSKEENKILEEENYVVKKKKGENLVIGSGYSICHPTFFIRKSSIQDVGFYDEKYKFAEDLAYQIKFLRKNKSIHLINKTLMYVRKHSNSKSKIEIVENAEETMRLRIDYINDKYCLENKRLFIWGAGGGGELLTNYLSRICRNINIVGFIDTYKEGTFNNYKIIDYKEIKEYNYDYILIATRPGKVYAQQILSRLGIKALEKYFTIFT